MSNKIKYSGLIVFGLFIVAFIIDIIASASNFDLMQSLEPAEQTLALYMTLGEIAISLVIIVSSCIAVYSLLKPVDYEKPMRMATDIIGAFCAYFLVLSIFLIASLSRYAENNGLKYTVPGSTIVELVLSGIIVVLSVICSAKAIKVNFQLKCFLGMIASLVFTALLIVIITSQTNAIIIATYAITITAALASILFLFFNYEESKKSKVVTNQVVEDLPKEENKNE